MKKRQALLVLLLLLFIAIIVFFQKDPGDMRHVKCVLYQKDSCGVKMIYHQDLRYRVIYYPDSSDGFIYRIDSCKIYDSSKTRTLFCNNCPDGSKKLDFWYAKDSVGNIIQVSVFSSTSEEAIAVKKQVQCLLEKIQERKLKSSLQ